MLDKKILLRLISAAAATGVLMTAVSLPAFAKELPSGIDSEALHESIMTNGYLESDKTETAIGISVFDTSNVLYEEYAGYANKEKTVPFDENMVCEWGSCTKLTVWVSAMQLAEQGKLDLTQDIRTYLPDGFLRRLKYDEPITMLNLMCHNAGFEETIVGMSAWNLEDIVSLEEYLTSTQPAQVFRPGEYTAYSNWSCTLAAYIVERISGMEYWQYVHQNIFTPLGMEHTAILPDLSDNPDVQQTWQNLDYYGTNGAYSHSKKWYVIMYPAGMCVSTLGDFKTFAQALLRNDERLLKPETYEEMYTPTSYYTGTEIARNCHGFWGEEFQSHVIGHGGNTAGCTSYLRLDLENNIGMVYMTNQAGDQFEKDAAEVIFGAYDGEYIMKNTTYTGCIKVSRSIFEGPLKIASESLSLMIAGDPTDVFGNQFIVETPDIYEYNVQDILKVNYWSGCRGTLLILAYLGISFAGAVVLVVTLIRFLLKKKSKNPLHRWHIACCLLHTVSAVPSIAALVTLLNTLNIQSPAFYHTLFASYIPIGILQIALFVYGTAKLCTPAYKTTGKFVKFRNLVSLLAIVIAIVSILFFQLWKFWLV